MLSTVPSGGKREGMTAVEQETEVTYREYRGGCWCWESMVTFLTQKEWEFLPGVRDGWGSWTPYSRAEGYRTNCREIPTLAVSRRVEAKLELLGEIAMEGGALQESHGDQLYLLSSSGMKSGGEMILF